ncbi:hypothetical protein BGZ98_005811 [Dissophora globulifera]|nr:hypothetical protein BGZ98_005811 [Dissophora globulifera]
MSIGVNVGPLFKQIGIYDELASLGKVCDTVDNYNEDREKLFSMELGHVLEMTGLQGFIIARSVMHDLMWRQVPTDKIHLGKRVLSMKQNEYGVQIQFSDNTMAEGDILIGADGAYSAVRQSLYARLKKDGLLPSSDDGGLPFSCVYLAGQTNPMNPAMYPELTDPVSRFSSVTSLDKPYSWSSMTVKDNIYCWGVIQYLDSATSKDNDSFRNSEWGPEAAQTMSNEVRDLPLPLGNGKMTMADLIDNSPLISKVMLEEKVFETWYSGRTALLGDACHKHLGDDFY